MQIEQWVKDNLFIIGGVGIGIALIEVRLCLVIFLTINRCSKLRSYFQRVWPIFIFYKWSDRGVLIAEDLRITVRSLDETHYDDNLCLVVLKHVANRHARLRNHNQKAWQLENSLADANLSL